MPRLRYLARRRSAQARVAAGGAGLGDLLVEACRDLAGDVPELEQAAGAGGALFGEDDQGALASTPMSTRASRT